MYAVLEFEVCTSPLKHISYKSYKTLVPTIIIVELKSCLHNMALRPAVYRC